MKRKMDASVRMRGRNGTLANRSHEKGQTAFEYLLLLGAVLLIVLLVNIVMRSTATKTDNKIKDELVTVDNLLTLCTNEKNIVQNAGFELDSDSDGVPDSWSFNPDIHMSGRDPNNGRYNSDAHKGSWSFYCNTGDETHLGICTAMQDIPIDSATQAGKKITAAVWEKVENGVFLQIFFTFSGWDPGDPGIPDESTYREAGWVTSTTTYTPKYKLGNWQLLQTSGVIPATVSKNLGSPNHPNYIYFPVTKVTLSMTMSKIAANGKAWLDDVCFSVR